MEQTTIITGGASGIGLATAEWLLARGTRVHILDVSPRNLEQAQETLSAYPDVGFDQVDVTNEYQLGQAMQGVSCISGLVSCAGYARDIPFLETSIDVLREMLEVNLLAPFSACQKAAKAMQTSGGGGIVIVSSVSGQVGNEGRAAYGASKAALINLTKVMANELARDNIRVNCVCPGPIASARIASLHTPERKLLWKNRVPQGRYGTPEEVAGVIGFLLDGNASSYVTGQTIGVDGGFVSSGLITS